MAKFYCQSGSFQTILAAPTVESVASKIAKFLSESQCPHSMFLSVDERGFGHNDSELCSLIPFFRDLGVYLPPPTVLVEVASRMLDIDPDEDFVNWLLCGERM